MLYISEPRYIPRIWGSLMTAGQETPIGEIWWLFQKDGTSSKLRSTSDGDSTTVNDLVLTGELPGKEVYPVLLKTLHTADRLSVQVHPGIEGGSLRKEETWIVLAAKENAWMMGGLKVTGRNLLLDLLRQNKAEEALQEIDLVKGDIYHLPPGTVHALGPGLEILEVQSNCDVTYRLYDWGRTGADGKPRELHIEKGVEAVNWSSGGKPVAAGSKGQVNRLKLNADYRVTDIRGTMEMSMPGGALFFVSSGSADVRDRKIDSPVCLIADTNGGKLELDGSGYLIEPGGN
ncbi:MAG: class I mannose-6-phosphate isomerase [Candidatus Aegiribacteria sp.]|nr:class I mannose-6-phosphate isomerase [Candidatus Aegiribacteria sp.]